jgi:ribosomal protein S18 acetylase RimI-like enzyme
MIANEENVRMLIDGWKLMTGRFAGSDFQIDRGVSSTFANIPLLFMNFSIQNRPAADKDDLRLMLQRMQQRAKECPHPSVAGLCEEWIPEAGVSIAAEAGFTFALNVTGMAADSLLPLRRPLPELEYRRVEDDGTARDLATMNAKGYGMPMQMWECICNMHLWHPDTYAYVGYRDGTAVSAAASFPIDGAIYIGLVATDPEAQGKGYGEAVMRRSIEQAQKNMGNRRMVLHASEMGQPLYRSMGFQAGGKILLFSPN